jgi:hypothetical protein
MIFSKDLLFIHIPKTGGMSVSSYLLKVLPLPVYYAQPHHDDELTTAGITQIDGTRHETLLEASQVVSQFGFDVRRFPIIFAVVRNPYALEVSRYAYLRIGHPWDRGPNQTIAMTSSFETFALQSTFHGGSERPIENYLLLDGQLPENMRVLRFENLAADVSSLLESIGLTISDEFPWLNKSKHSDFRAYYTAAAEEAVYRRYQWLFDNHYYERMSASEFQQNSDPNAWPSAGLNAHLQKVSGYWEDGWISKEFVFRFSDSHQPLTEMIMHGEAPRAIGEAITLTLNSPDFVVTQEFRTGTPFRWRVPLQMSPGSSCEVCLTSNSAWCPANDGVLADQRWIAFRLHSIQFESEEASPHAPNLEPKESVQAQG